MDQRIHAHHDWVQMLTLRNLNMVTREVPAGLIQDWMWQGAAAADAVCKHVPNGAASACQRQQTIDDVEI